MSPDPTVISRDLTDPQSWNMYSYTFNNPLALVDPDGKWPTPFRRMLDQNYFGKELHFSSNDVAVIVNESADQDGFFNGGQAAFNSFMHDMRNGYKPGDAASANAATGADIASEIGSAVESQLYSEWSAQHSEDDGPISYGHDDALKHLANAEHAAQDSTSPEHGGKPWWGIDTPTSWVRAGRHALDEYFSSHATSGSDEAAQQEAAYQTQVVYSQYVTRLNATRKSVAIRTAR